MRERLRSNDAPCKCDGHPAKLSLGACVLARQSGEPLLFKGGDLAHTDTVAALPIELGLHSRSDMQPRPITVLCRAFQDWITQFSMDRLGMSRKSVTLSVTRTEPLLMACAAIIRS